MIIKTEQNDYSSRYNQYNENNKFVYKIDNIKNKQFLKFYEELKIIDLENLDEKILKALIRFKKFKSNTNIEDKIIELILSIEYLINTLNHEVNLQIRLKIISFAREIITEKEKLYKNIQKFLTLRADVIHGNKEVKYTEKNIQLIEEIETIQAYTLYKFIILNQKYSFSKINEALSKTLYEFNPIEDILINDCG